MIDIANPDFLNTPAHTTRAVYDYTPECIDAPEVSIITPYYNTGSVFAETVIAVQRMSFTNWEWIIVDDGSTDAESLERLEALRLTEARVRVVHQPNRGPGVARNHAASLARGRYLMFIDSDDLVEPTFLEKCMWFLETQPQFSFCNGWSAGFGSQNYLWTHGFDRGVEFLNQNWVIMCAVVRRDAHLACGGYDPDASYEHADWDYWLNMAECDRWGYTVPELFTWYRRQENSLIGQIQQDREREERFKVWLQKKHQGLSGRFPNPIREKSIDLPYAEVRDDIPLKNPLCKPNGKIRVLHLMPWLNVGGSDKFSLDLIRSLTPLGYQFTIATTINHFHPWYHLFAEHTPDIFCLERFLNYADFPRFLSYLIESRQIDVVLISNSQMSYELTPFLRAHHPHVAFVDYNHMEQPEWINGGYPGIAVRAQSQFDLNITATNHLKQWMVEHGASESQIAVCHCNVDVEQLQRDSAQAQAVCDELGVMPNRPLLAFVGRLTAQKRPELLIEIANRLVRDNIQFLLLIIGDGELRSKIETLVAQYHLNDCVRLMGSIPPTQVYRWLSACDILLLPSAHEGLALVLYEALALQVVPVAANVGGHAELITPDVGVLIDQQEGEIKQYVEAVKWLISHPEQRAEMAVRGRQRVEDAFSLTKMAQNMDKLLCQATVLAQTQPKPILDKSTARYIAHMAVEFKRTRELADVLWNRPFQAESIPARTDVEREYYTLVQTRAFRAIRLWWEIKQRVKSLFTKSVSI